MVTSSQVPVLVLIDVEPNGFFIGAGKVPWSGFERALDIMAEVRRTLSQQTRHRVQFTWLVRADAQIAETYGSPAWALEHYRDAFAGLLDAGDEVGLHVHAYRWDEEGTRWIEDYGNQEWVNHCIHLGVGAFERHFKRLPASFSMGMDWTNQDTIRLLSELQIRYEFSTVLNKESQPFPPRDTYTGVLPHCSQIPERPYRPSPQDFRCAADSEAGGGMWLVPQSSRVADIPPSWKRRLWDAAHGQPQPGPCTRKFFLQDDPADLRPAIDDMLRRLKRPYLTFAVRTHEFCSSEVIAIIRRNLESALERREASTFVFTTPAEALRILGYEDPAG